jgi:hypothetical protein
LLLLHYDLERQSYVRFQSERGARFPSVDCRQKDLLVLAVNVSLRRVRGG